MVQFFHNKRVMDVSCGENFTVVIAEVEGDPMKQTKFNYGQDLLIVKKTD